MNPNNVAEEITYTVTDEEHQGRSSPAPTLENFANIHFTYEQQLTIINEVAAGLGSTFGPLALNIMCFVQYLLSIISATTRINQPPPANFIRDLNELKESMMTAWVRTLEALVVLHGLPPASFYDIVQFPIALVDGFVKDTLDIYFRRAEPRNALILRFLLINNEEMKRMFATLRDKYGVIIPPKPPQDENSLCNYNSPFCGNGTCDGYSTSFCSGFTRLVQNGIVLLDEYFLEPANRTRESEFDDNSSTNL